MTEDELKELYATNTAEEVILLKDLKNRQPRTLLYGYDVDRYTFHIYLENNLFNLTVYQGGNWAIGLKHVASSQFVESWIPNKRLYPEACDFEFCKLMPSLRGWRATYTRPGSLGEDTEKRFKETGFYGLRGS